MDEMEIQRSTKKLEMLIAMQLPCYDNGKRFTFIPKHCLTRLINTLHSVLKVVFVPHNEE